MTAVDDRHVDRANGFLLATQLDEHRVDLRLRKHCRGTCVDSEAAGERWLRPSCWPPPAWLPHGGDGSRLGRSVPRTARRAAFSSSLARASSCSLRNRSNASCSQGGGSKRLFWLVGCHRAPPDSVTRYTSRKRTLFACRWMNSFRGSTWSPMRSMNASSAAIASSRVTCRSVALRDPSSSPRAGPGSSHPGPCTAGARTSALSASPPRMRWSSLSLYAYSCFLP